MQALRKQGGRRRGFIRIERYDPRRLWLSQRASLKPTSVRAAVVGQSDFARLGRLTTLRALLSNSSSATIRPKAKQKQRICMLPHTRTLTHKCAHSAREGEG
jgi:hypothetical protein